MTSGNKAACIRNKRGHFRLKVNLDAFLQLDGDKFEVKIVDLSTTGLRIECDRVFPAAENITLRFMLHHHHVALRCSIVHAEVAENESDLYSYGVKYSFVSVYDLRVITSYTFEAEARSLRK